MFQLSLTKNPYYKMAEIIVAKKEPFTLDSLMEDLKNQGVNLTNRNKIEKILNRYRKEGLVKREGNVYTVSAKFAR